MCEFCAKEEKEEGYIILVENGFVKGVIKSNSMRSSICIREIESFDNIFREAADMIARLNIDSFAKMREEIDKDSTCWRITEEILYGILSRYQAIL